MRRFLVVFLALTVIFALCACSVEDSVKERDCGLYITVEADDVYVVSYGTDKGSESVSNADDDEPLPVGDVVHFDIGGKKAEKKADYIVDYSVCIYDRDMEVINVASFSDNFGNMAKVEITVTADHHIIHTGDPISCGGDVIVDIEQTEPEADVSIAVPVVTISGNENAQNTVNDSIAAVNSEFSGSEKDAYKSIYDANIAAAGSGATETDFSIARTVRAVRGDSSMLSLRMVDRALLANENSLKIFGLSYDTSTGSQILFADLSDDAETLRSFCIEKLLTATTEEERFKNGSILFNTGYTEALSSLISDGHWFFNDVGMVIAVNPGEIAAADAGYFEFTIPYSELDGKLSDRWMPVEHDGDYGSISAVSATDANLITVGDSNDAAAFSLTVTGNVYNVGVYTINYTSDGNYVLVSQLRYCSDMSRGAAFPINAELESSPSVYVGYNTADGVRHNRLIAMGTDGSPTVTDPDGGDNGLVINSGYVCDINGNGDTASVEFSSGKLAVTRNDKTFEAAIDVVSEARLMLYDIDGDCAFEIFVSGKDASGSIVSCGYKLSSELYEIFASEGSIYEFNGSAVMIGVGFDFVNVFTILSPYTCVHGQDGLISLAASSAAHTFTDGATLTLAADLRVGSITCTAGSVLSLSATDASSYIDCIHPDGSTVRLNIAKASDGSWNVAGRSASSVFVS